MKASLLLLRRDRRKESDREERPLRRAAALGVLLIALSVAAAAALGIGYALFSRTFPSLELFEAYYTAQSEPTRFYASDGETLLFTLAYERVEGRDLRICESDGEGCMTKTFVEAAAAGREEKVRSGDALPFEEEMVREVYAEQIQHSSYPQVLQKLLTRQVRLQWSRNQLLEWYLNRAWFGQMAFGPDAAARLYLDKGADSLSNSESVLLSAILSAPMLNPIDSNGAVRESYLNQLELLCRNGLFSAEEGEALKNANFVIYQPPAFLNGSSPDIITQKALHTLINLYGKETVERGGLKVITSEKASLQAYLNCLTSPLSSQKNEQQEDACPLSETLPEAERKAAREAAAGAEFSAALIDVDSGQLLAAVESRPDDSGQMTRQTSFRAENVGSTMNIFTALSAFSQGSSPSTLLWDLETVTNDGPEGWQNPDGIRHGPVRFREAASQDYQLALNSALQPIGESAVLNQAAAFGLPEKHQNPEHGILFEGAAYTAEELAYALTAFAGMGTQSGTNLSGVLHPITILSVEWADGHQDTPQPVLQKSILSENLAWLVHDVFSRDTLSNDWLDRPALVKIGRVYGEESLWVSGYTTRVACALRTGASPVVSAFITDEDHTESGALALWRSIMEQAVSGTAEEGWEIPEDISQVRICLPSGKLPGSACEETDTEVFLRGNEPYEVDDYYQTIVINRTNGLMATRFTPENDRETKAFLQLPDFAAKWAAANGIEEAPTAYDPISTLPQNKFELLSPEVFQVCDPAEGAINVEVQLDLPQTPLSFQVTEGSGMNPEAWTEVCSGGALENGKWQLCTLDPSTLGSGLHALRVAFTLPYKEYISADTYFTIP